MEVYTKHLGQLLQSSVYFLLIFTYEGVLQLQGRTTSWLTWCVGLNSYRIPRLGSNPAEISANYSSTFGLGKSALSLVCLKDPWTQITIGTELGSNKFSGPPKQSSSGFPSGFSRVFLRTNEVRCLSDMAQRQMPMPENTAKCLIDVIDVLKVPFNSLFPELRS